jgi:endonuclease G
MKTAVLAISCLLVAGSALASPTSCPRFYLNGVAPDIQKASMTQRTREVCYSDFGIVHSGLTATPLWSAEDLTAEKVRLAKAVPRVDAFFPETSLPADERAELSHYRSSGFDRGHMSPSADMSTVRAQAESFSLANMVPQTAALNRKLWAEIESTTRGLALSYGEVFVVTGPAFGGATLNRIGGRVMVPTATWKAIYIPSMAAAGVWWAENTQEGRSFEVISLSELARRTSIDAFPEAPDDVKAVAAGLPRPQAGADAAAGSRSKAEAEPTRPPAAAPGAWSSVARDVGSELLRRWMR